MTEGWAAVFPLAVTVLFASEPWLPEHQKPVPHHQQGAGLFFHSWTEMAKNALAALEGGAYQLTPR